ncbi:hypothetical protein WA158_001177 [Blastocystis sp. Blastoise]
MNSFPYLRLSKGNKRTTKGSLPVIVEEQQDKVYECQNDINITEGDHVVNSSLLSFFNLKKKEEDIRQTRYSNEAFCEMNASKNSRKTKYPVSFGLYNVYLYMELQGLLIPSEQSYLKRIDFQEIKRHILWVPAILSLNYACLFIWISFFYIIWSSQYIPLIEYYGYFIFFIVSIVYTCFILINGYKQMDRSLYIMACNNILIFISGIIATTLNNVTHFLHVPGPLLYDIGFEYIPEVFGVATEYSNRILIAFIGSCVCLSLVYSPDVRNKMWCDFGRIASVMIVCKGFLGWMTLLPGPAPHCRLGSENYPPTSIQDIFIRQGVLFGKSYNCGDLIYSGHTGFVVIVALLSMDLFRYSKPIYKYTILIFLYYFLNIVNTNYILIYKYLWGMYCFVAILLFSYFCIAARKHYSVDIASAIIITILMYFTFRNDWNPHKSYSETIQIHLGQETVQDYSEENQMNAQNTSNSIVPEQDQYLSASI